jgi:hypothetical protein
MNTKRRSTLRGSQYRSIPSVEATPDVTPLYVLQYVSTFFHRRAAQAANAKDAKRYKKEANRIDKILAQYGIDPPKGT